MVMVLLCLVIAGLARYVDLYSREHPKDAALPGRFCFNTMIPGQEYLIFSMADHETFYRYVSSAPSVPLERGFYKRRRRDRHRCHGGADLSDADQGRMAL